MEKRKLLICMLAMAVVLSTTVIGFANVDVAEADESLLQNVLVEQYDQPEISSRIVPTVLYALNFQRDSSTKATADVSIRADMKVDVISSTITLQKYSTSAGGYVDASATPATQSGTNTYAIHHRAVFKVGASGQYRMKVVVKNKEGGTTLSDTFYKKLV